MMKKRLSTLMLLALAVVLSACGQSITPSPTQTTDSNAEDKTSGQGQPPASNGADNDNNTSNDPQRNSNADPSNDSNKISPDSENESKDSDVTDTNPVDAKQLAEGLGREGVPLSLPKDFPLPEEFSIKTAYADVDGEGKNSVLLIYSTDSSLEEIAKMYKDYFKAHKFSVNSQIVDKTTLVFQAEDKELGQSWSLIGGLLAPDLKVMQVTLDWEEL